MTTQTISPKSLLANASGLFSFLLLATPLAAQSDAAVLRGRVADAADSPLSGAVVVLHAVTDEGGVELARDTADAAGGFELRYEARSGALYFVATRLAGGIYMAEPFRGSPPDGLVLRAGAGVEPLRLDGFQSAPAGAALRAAAGEDATHAGWWVAALATVIVGFIAWLLHRARHRAPRSRELMVEIARLDETRERAGAAGSDEAYRARRAELRARLAEALELDDDADRH